MLDKCKVKSRRICDGLHAELLRRRWGNRLALVRRGVAVVQRDGGLILNCEWSLEIHSEVRILGASITGIPTEVNVELQQVCQSSDIFSAGRLTARQGTKYIQVDRLFALRYQVGVQESRVAHFIVRVVGDVLWHIAI